MGDKTTEASIRSEIDNGYKNGHQISGLVAYYRKNMRKAKDTLEANGTLEALFTSRNLLYNQVMLSMVKRSIDILVAIVGGTLLIPVFVAIAISIKLDSKGPIFYVQERCGRSGKVFGMCKFRSMVENADILKRHLKNEIDGSVFKIKNDPRITRIGRFLRRASIDELPQLFNVLRGDMSLVGPRPLSSEEMQGSSEWKEIRLKVRPGITGIWQVKARGNIRFKDWIAYDTYYVKNKSLLLDIKILVMTIGVVIRGKGAY